MTDQSNETQTKAALPGWAISLIGGAALVIVLASALLVFRWMYGLASGNEITVPDFGSGGSAETQSLTSTDPGTSPTGGNNAFEIGSAILSPSTYQSWTGTERVTILVLGIDQRCDEVGPNRTDTMMLLTIDPVAKTAGILSLPRDTWVDIPGYGFDRINQANYYGQIYEHPGGGQALAMETVESFLGIVVDHYLTINFDAFIELVDQVDGIDIDVPEAINDPRYPDRCYGEEGFFLEDGEQHLDGELALKYARTRVTAGGDIDRATRQQVVLMAIREKLQRLDMIPQLIARSPQIWKSLQNNVRTSLTDVQMIQLALLMQEIPREDIQARVIEYGMLYNETTADGRQVLVPDREKIRALRDELFPAIFVPQPVINDLDKLMLAEGAKVVVFNGTQVFGLAGDTRDYLIRKGVDVIDVGNADSSTVPATQITLYGDFQNTALYLTQVMNLPPLAAVVSEDKQPEYDVLIVLGKGWIVPGTAPAPTATPAADTSN